MAEIEARLDQLDPTRKSAGFQTMLNKVGGGGLSGTIGGNGFKPFDPTAPGVTTKSAPELRAMIEKAADSQSLPVGLLDAVVSAESSHNPESVSDKGAMGLMQLMPGTASALGVSNPFDPMQNLMGGAKYLKQLMDWFGGDLPTALAAYNAGPNRIKDTSRPWPSTTVDYVNKIMSIYKGNGAG